MSCNPRMHTGLILISACIRGFDRFPYAYGDSMTCDPRMHTGIKINPRMHMGIAQIPVCIWGFNENPCIHTGIARHVIPLCIRGLILIPLCIQGFERRKIYYGALKYSTNDVFDVGGCTLASKTFWFNT